MTDAPHILGVGQIARSVSDIGTAKDWYGRVLGLEHLFTFGDLAFFSDPDGRPLAIMAVAGPSDDATRSE